jgi:hypothetical protein
MRLPENSKIWSPTSNTQRVNVITSKGAAAATTTTMSSIHWRSKWSRFKVRRSPAIDRIAGDTEHGKWKRYAYNYNSIHGPDVPQS